MFTYIPVGETQDLPMNTRITGTTSVSRQLKESWSGIITKKTKTGYTVRMDDGKWFTLQFKYVTKIG